MDAVDPAHLGGYRTDQRKPPGAKAGYAHEQVLVEITPVQVSLFDTKEQQAGARSRGQEKGHEMIGGAGEEEELNSFIEDEPGDASNVKVVKEFKSGQTG